MVLFSAILVILALRYGLVALIAAEIAANFLRAFPTTLNFSAWYVGIGLIGPLAVLVLAAFAFHTSLGGQKIFEGQWLDE